MNESEVHSTELALSIIIPAFNSAGTIGKLLESIMTQADDAIEVIVVDDCSTDKTSEVVRAFPRVRLLRTESQGGPAGARNLGAHHASHDMFVFTDADTVFEDETISGVRRFFTSQPEAVCAMGAYSRIPANNGFTSRYKALWEYAMIEKGSGRGDVVEVKTIGPRPAMVRRDLFEKLGGFDAKGFKGAEIEDMEFGYRAAKTGPVYMVKYITIRHHYPASFMKELRPFARRSFLWVRTFRKHRVFEGFGEASVENLFANAAALLLPVAIACALWYLWAWLVVVVCVAVFVGANWRFYRLTVKEEGLLFAVRCVLIRYVHVVVLAAAAGLSVLTLPFAREKEKAGCPATDV